MGGPPGGKGYDIRTHSSHTNIMYVTDAHAGVFRSFDSGQSWMASNTGFQRESSGRVPAFSVTIDPHNNDRIWAGMEVSGQVYLSWNGGDSWQLRDAGLPGLNTTIRGITVDPSNSQVVYAAAEVYTDVAETFQGWGGSSGAVYRTSDYGLSWSLFWEGDALARYVVVDPTAPNRVFISTGIFDMDAANSTVTVPGGVGIARTENGGRSWEILDERRGLPGRRVPSLAMEPTRPDLLLAAVIDPTQSNRPWGVYVTYDGGDSWTGSLTTAACGPNVIDPTEQVHAVEIPKNTPEIWYAAGRPTFGDQGVFWRSDNHGETWHRNPINIHGYQTGTAIDIEVNPSDSDHIFINNYGGGNVVSLDGGQTWTDASHGYSGAETRAIALEPGTRANVIASGNVGTFRSVNYDAFEGVQIIPNEGLQAHSIAFVPTGRASHYLLVGNGFGDIFFNHGSTWTPAANPPRSLAQIPFDSTMANFAFSEQRPNEIFTGFYHRGCERFSLSLPPYCGSMPCLLVSGDGGEHWSEVLDFPVANSPVFDVEIGADPERVYVGTQRGLCYTTPSGWVLATDLTYKAAAALGSSNPRRPMDSHVTSIAIDPNNENTLLAATSPGVLFRSTDRGLTWTSAAAGLSPNEVATDIVFDPNPARSSTVYLASDEGVRFSLNGGASWQTIDSGLDFRRTTMLAISDDGGVLYVGTFGGGVYQLQAESIVDPNDEPVLVF